MAIQRQPMRRLHGKQPWPAHADKTRGKERKPRRSRKGGVTRKAIAAEGLIPKARRPFALYVKENSTVPKGSSREDFQNEMKRLGKAFRALSDAEHQEYKERCHAEFLQQRDAMKIQGLPLRPDLASLKPEQPAVEQSQQPEPIEQPMAKFGEFTLVNNKEQLGEGSYGNVLACIAPEGYMCAVKLYKSKQTLVDFKQEVWILQRIHQELRPSQQRLFPTKLAADEAKKPWPFVAMEFGGPSLLTCLRSTEKKARMTAQAVQCLATQLKAALAALHTMQILHLDVKPANILWAPESFHMKLADFGMSEAMGTKPEKLRFGEYVTSFYRPPELFAASLEEISRHLHSSVDIWSYGCVLFECLVGRILMRPCKDAQHEKTMVQHWCRSWKHFQCQARCRSSAKLTGAAETLQLRMAMTGVWHDTIKRCLHPEPSSRSWN